MSVKVMGLVWDLEIERDLKYILLAYADHADHEGKNIFPAVATIARKTGYSERSVQAITRQLESLGLLLEDGKGPKGTNKWRIPLQGGAEIAPVQNLRGAENDEGGCRIEHDSTEKGVQPTAPEPSFNRPLTEDIKKQKESSDIQAQIAWDSTLRQLQLEMPKPVFEAKLRDTWALSLQAGRMTICVPDDERRAWLENRVRTPARRILQGILNENKLELVFELSEAT